MFPIQGGAPGLKISDVFATALYTGNGSSQNITNGLNLSAGGLVWVKSRSLAQSHALVDTARGAPQTLSTDQASAQTGGLLSVTGFLSNGFSVGSDPIANGNTSTYASWSFRKAPKFFDVVTYAGNGATQNISHSLGIAPSIIIVKATSAATDWRVYMVSAGASNYIALNSTARFIGSTTTWNNTAPTSSVFSVGADSVVNNSGVSYVAYLLAHDTTGTGLVRGGTFDTSASASTYTGATLGWEPQWLLLKNATTSGNWHIVDSTRLLNTTGNVLDLFPNSNTVEQSYSTAVRVNSTGFEINSDFFGVSQQIHYIAIRKP
jgi:hypothetical protein